MKALRFGLVCDLAWQTIEDVVEDLQGRWGGA